MRITVQNGVFLRVTDHAEPKPADLWCVHGFGESGLCFREIHDSALASMFNIYVPDLPGHGVSLPDTRALSMDGIVDVLVETIHAVSGTTRPVIILGHSLGGIIGTRLARRLGPQTAMYINVEGNLTTEDAYFTGMTRGHEDPGAFYRTFCDYILSQIEPKGTLQRYFASLRFAHTPTLHSTGRSCADASREDVAGAEFVALTCPKIYYWSTAGTADVTRAYIQSNQLPNRCFEGDDPWLMCEFGDWLYNPIAEDLTRHGLSAKPASLTAKPARPRSLAPAL